MKSMYCIILFSHCLNIVKSMFKFFKLWFLPRAIAVSYTLPFAKVMERDASCPGPKSDVQEECIALPSPECLYCGVFNS